MLHKIGELRKPKTNVQIIQKSALLKYHYLMQFLRDAAPEIADEVRSTYVETMSRILHSLFKVGSKLPDLFSVPSLVVACSAHYFACPVDARIPRPTTLN